MKRPISEIIGFQLISRLHGLHPHMAGSFCVYSLMQVQQMLLTTPKTDKEPYAFLRIYKGDVEEPTMMFTGSPFTSDGNQLHPDPLGEI